jgi:Flp pilus assembly protein TadG
MASLRKRLGQLRLALVSRAGQDTGAELIEFALVFPIFLVIFGAMIDFGFLFQRYEVITNAAREGARVAVLQGYTVADAQSRVSSYLTASGLTPPSPSADVTYSTAALPSGLTVKLVTVTVHYPSGFVFMAPFVGMIRGSAPATITLNATSTMRMETGGS